MTRRTALAGCLALFLAPAARAADKPSAPARTGTVASVGGEAIDASELEAAGGARLFSLYTQEYQLRKQLLDDLINKRLLDGKAPAVTEAEQKAYYEQNKARFGPMAEADALKQAESLLRQQKITARRVEFVMALRKAANIKVMLEPPRIKVDATGGPAKGPEGAPITIVEYADFQCPYCGRAMAALKQVEERYQGKIRLVFRDFPLTQIHPNAAKAAEAADCANDQGKFWPMHDRLFANQTKLAVADLKQHASDIGLDKAAFETCLDSGKHAADWKKTVEEGQKYGLSGTPSFFINGRLIVGAQPYESFAVVIDEELDRAARPADSVASQTKSRP